MRDNTDATPVYLAAQSDHFDIVKELLQLDKEGARERLLHLAVSKDSSELLDLALRFDPDIDWKDGSGVSAFHLAIQKHRISMIKELHEKGASISMTDKDGRTPLYLAVENQDLLDVDTVTTLLDLEDADSENTQLEVDKPYHGVTPFLKLCRHFPFNRKTEIIVTIARLLLAKYSPKSSSRGININIQHPETGRTPVHYASDTEIDDLTILLLEHGADPSKPNNRGSTPILLAAEMGKIESIKALVGKGASFQHANNSGITALHRAAYSDFPECVRFLLDEGADPNYANDWGYTPLGLAVTSGYVRCVKEFLEYRARHEDKPGIVDFTVKNNDGLCILGQAAEDNQDDVIEVLLEAMEETEIRLALHNVVMNGSSEILSYLLEKTKEGDSYRLDNERYGSLLGAAVAKQKNNIVEALLEFESIQIDQVDKDRRTPLMYAVMLEDSVLIGKLLDRKANPNSRDAGNETPLSCAIKKGGWAIVEALIKADGVDLEQEDARGHSSLYWDCRSRGSGEVFDAIYNAIVQKSSAFARLCSLAIHGAVASSREESLLRLLKVEGIDVNAKDNDGWTPLQIAKCYSHERLKAMLLEANAKPGPDPPELIMPTGWHPGDKQCSLSVTGKTSSVVEVTHPSYTLDDDESKDATHAIARANHCPPYDRDWYFEVKILEPKDPGSKDSTSTFGIGICEDNMELGGMLGFGSSGVCQSFGYHSDDGDVYPSYHGVESRDMPASQRFSSADSSVGCGFNCDGKTIYFTKNGEYLGIAFGDIPGAKFYPAIFTGTSRVGLGFEIAFDSAKWDFDPKAPRERSEEGSDEYDRYSGGTSGEEDT
ncbi:ankyrin repeat-containing domain protein [Rostrohypoxylon terebratum]|nr:ankyrin repeat-containing domain protein [Rostrohypoxylon terebratum]